MSYANPGRRVIGDQDVQSYLRRKGDDANVQRFLAKNLARGNALNAQVTNKASAGKYATRGDVSWLSQTPYGRSDKDIDKRYGRGAANNIAALFGGDELNLAPGTVFTGATRVTTPRSESWNPLGGSTSTPESTRYDLTVLPRNVFAGGGRGSAAGSGDDAPAPKGADDSGVQAAREAVARANQYQQSSSGGSSGSAASGSGRSDNLFENIFSLGQGQVDDYERRFIPRMQAESNLQTAEVGYGLSNTLANLPEGFEPPDYFDPFEAPRRKNGRRGTSLYDRLRRQIT